MDTATAFPPVIPVIPVTSAPPAPSALPAQAIGGQGDGNISDLFRQAFRRNAGAVWAVTAAHNGQRSGLTATSVVSLSADPAELMVSVQAGSSSLPLIQAAGRFGVNLLGQQHQAVANRFAGRDGCQGDARYADAPWQATADGVWLLQDALAALACEVSELILRDQHALVIGRITAAHLPTAASAPALIYTHGRYTTAL